MLRLKKRNIPYILQGNDYGGYNPLVGMINGVKVLIADEMIDQVKSTLITIDGKKIYLTVTIIYIKKIETNIKMVD